MTVCTHDRRKVFEICSVGRDPCVPPSPATEIAVFWLLRLESKFPGCHIHKAVIMPNHIHMIVELGMEDAAAHTGAALQQIMQWYKTMTANAYMKGVKAKVLPPFHKSLWQRSYYDHIIRNDADYLRIWQYIHENPARWAEDEYNDER